MKEVQLETFKSGRFEQGRGYKYFVPEPVNTEWRWSDPQLNNLLERASIQLGELNSFARLVPNIDLFIHLHVTKEAVISSRIEGTQTRIDEALLHEEDILPERRDDWLEVQNYTKALNEAVAELDTLPLSSRLIKKAHAALLEGVRGEHRLPGEFRSSQNWIGGSSPADAIFVPPSEKYVDALMGDLENFLHNEDIFVPDLVRAGIAHYQFETIHPFLDGNGRIGRLLITLYLVSRGLLDRPLLYLSAYFEKKKELYYDNLTRVRTKNDMLHWLKYFLIGVEETAHQAASTLRSVIAQKKEIEERINNRFGRRFRQGIKFLQYLYQDPIIQIKDVQRVCELTPKSAGELVNLLVDEQVLVELTGQSRNRVFAFGKYLDLFR